MRRESSEGRRGSATVEKSRWPWLARLGAVVLIAGAACSSTWTGSVGAVLGKDNRDGRLYIREVPPTMGAAKAGVEVGDEVIAIDGKPVVKMTPPEVHDALAGKVGTKVRVTVVRAGVTADFLIERGPLAGT
jgi:C-terminal processing protease CtpA/Prc